MIKSVGSSLSPQLGATYLRAPSFWIPGALYPSRPLPLSNWYMKEFYGSGLGLNENRSFFFYRRDILISVPLGFSLRDWLGPFFGSLPLLRAAQQGESGGSSNLRIYGGVYFQGVAGELLFPSSWGYPEQILSAVIVGL